MSNLKEGESWGLQIVVLGTIPYETPMQTVRDREKLTQMSMQVSSSRSITSIYIYRMPIERSRKQAEYKPGV